MEIARIDGVRVLVVDNEPDARELTQWMLEQAGAIVTTASSAAEALSIFGRQGFDVLVSDIGMPGEDGHALMRRIRALGPAGKGAIPALALTAYASPFDQGRALAAGFQMHASKPVGPSQLIAMVASLAARNSPPHGSFPEV